MHADLSAAERLTGAVKNLVAQGLPMWRAIIRAQRLFPSLWAAAAAERRDITEWHIDIPWEHISD